MCRNRGGPIDPQVSTSERRKTGSAGCWLSWLLLLVVVVVVVVAVAAAVLPPSTELPRPLAAITNSFSSAPGQEERRDKGQVT
jgi:hypothetical protein